MTTGPSTCFNCPYVSRMSDLMPERPMPQSFVSRKAHARFRPRLLRIGRRWLCALALLSWLAGAGVAQEERIYDQEPFDIILLDAANQNRELYVLPLDLPDRKLPDNPNPNATLRVRLVSDPEQELEVAWRGIARVELFEQRILQRARELIRLRKFDSAFQHLTFLHDNYPNVAGLSATLDQLLYGEAAVLYRDKQYERALLLLDEIYQRQADRQRVDVALTRILQDLLVLRFQAKDFRDARRIFDVARQRYDSTLSRFLNEWQQRFERAARAKMQQAHALLEEGREREAFLIARQVAEIWPATEGAAELLRETTRRYPLLTIGVLQAPANPDFPTSFHWGARRAERLLTRKLLELDEIGPEGGMYRAVVGEAEVAPDGRTFTLHFPPDAPAGRFFRGPTVARELLTRAEPTSPDFDRQWAAVLDRIRVPDVYDVEVLLRQPHLRVQSLLGIPLTETAIGKSSNAWSPYHHSTEESAGGAFVANPAYALAGAAQPREIVERVFENPRRAVQGLRRGEIDLLDRVFPADVANLQRDANLQVRAYCVPSLHLLVPNPARVYSGHRGFRRALTYATDRQRILRSELLGGRELTGCEVLSGPFPRGIDGDDPLAYAYDFQINPRAYDPRHARTLMQLAQIEIQREAQKNQETVPPMTELVVAFPPSELARVACAAIIEDWKLLGLTCVLRPLAPQEAWPVDEDWDFFYLDCVMQEPLVDAPRLLAADGLAGCTSPHLNLALRQLQRATSWKEAGDRLRAIHQICSDDASVIPLWQLVDHLAFRPELGGVSNNPVTTYQNIEGWSLQYANPE